MNEVTKDKSYVAVEDKIMALAKIDDLIDTPATEIERSGYDDSLFEVGGAEYLVLTDSEADQRCAECIKDSLWAFNASFLSAHMKNRLDKSGIDALQEMQSKLCESANPIVLNMIDDLDYLIEDAINADGRGYFLADYDFEEIEQGDFYIYRTN